MLSSDVNALPSAYPATLESQFQSLSGAEIQIRPIVPADAPRLQYLFTQLSPESVYRRFFTPRRALPDAEATELATVDYRTTLALVATLNEETEALVGVARFAATDERNQAVEMAIVVADAHQGQGIGRRLFAELAAAAQHLGYQWMLAETQADNLAMIELARHAGYGTETEEDVDSLKVWLDLRSTGRN